MQNSTKLQPTRVWLVRHGEPEISVRGRCYGSLDIGLSREGIHQIELVAARLSRERFAAIYTSPRQRCRQSAEILATGHDCPVDTVDELSEISFGEFEGCSYEEIEIRYPALYRQWMEHPTEIQFPGGESFDAMWTRVTEAASALRTRYSGQSIALITHSGVIRILMSQALAVPQSHIFRIAQRYAAVNLISYFESFSVVEFMNWSAEPS
jgi:alpha-ribazole phosphatase